MMHAYQENAAGIPAVASRTLAGLMLEQAVRTEFLRPLVVRLEELRASTKKGLPNNVEDMLLDFVGAFAEQKLGKGHISWQKVGKCPYNIFQCYEDRISQELLGGAISPVYG